MTTELCLCPSSHNVHGRKKPSLLFLITYLLNGELPCVNPKFLLFRIRKIGIILEITVNQKG